MKRRELVWWEEAVIAVSAWITVFVALMATGRPRRHGTRGVPGR